MSLLLIIYIIGVIVSFVTFLISENSDITLQDLVLMILVSLLSWIAFLVTIFLIYKDKVIIKANKNNNLKIRQKE